jgi:hypothetical protein
MNRTEKDAAYFVTHYQGQPAQTAMRCPSCAAEAIFESGYLAYDVLPSDIDPSLVNRWNQRLIVERYPDQLRWADPDNAAWTDRPARADLQAKPGESAVLGIVNCPSCGLRRRHLLRWPQDAAYQVDVRGEVLWAWSRAHLIAIRDYVALDHRIEKRDGVPIGKLPSHFLLAKNRAAVVKEIDRRLLAS